MQRVSGRRTIINDMSGHGVYRVIYSAMPDDPDFQRLTPDARLLLYTARLCTQAGPAVIFRYYPELLCRQTGLSLHRLRNALAALAEGSWIVYDDSVLWVRNGLRHDPHLRLSDKKHLAAVRRAIEGLPHSPIVLKFCEYYKITRPFEGPSEGSPAFTPMPLRAGAVTGAGAVTPCIPLTTPSEPLQDRNGHHPVALEVLQFLNDKAGRHYRPVKANLGLIEARLRDGITAQQLKAIITRKVAAWQGDPKMDQFLRPSTLFSRLNCEQYRGELP